MSLGNKIGLLTLIVTMISVFIALFPFIKTEKIKNKDEINLIKDNKSTYGNQSPVIENTDGDVKIEYN